MFQSLSHFQSKYIVTEDGLVPANPNKRSRLAFYSPTDCRPIQAEIEICKNYLSECWWVPAKRACQGSYHLKHLAEKHDPRGYVTNGAFIQAAIELGLRVEPDGSCINALIYVKRPNRMRGRFLYDELAYRDKQLQLETKKSHN